MNSSEVTIATITLARNSEEESELTDALLQLALHNIPVVIADGGSLPSFLQFLKNIPQFTVLPGISGGVWPQAKASVGAAFERGTPFIFYTEPDKKSFFQNGLLPFLNAATVETTTGIILASRSAAAFGSFPLFQQMTETTINNCCAEMLGKRLDYCYGPFLFNKKLVPYLDGVIEDIGWGWRPYLFYVAHRLGYSVDAFVNDFFCPPEQRGDDEKERLYRMKQLEQNIRGLVLSVKAT